jgi:hypothetical protein
VLTGRGCEVMDRRKLYEDVEGGWDDNKKRSKLWVHFGWLGGSDRVGIEWMLLRWIGEPRIGGMGLAGLCESTGQWTMMG